MFVRFVVADSGSAVNWMDGSPALAKEADYSGPTEHKTCTDINMQVQRSLTSSPFESHCYIPTAMGLMTQLYYTSGIVQPLTYSKAYPVNFQRGGNPIIDPIPSQASGLYSIGWSQGAGSIYGYYRQLSNIMQLNVGTSGISYSIPSTASPDFIFSKANGEAAPLNSMTRATSQNGRYMVIDGLGAGFVRVNLMNLTVKSFAPTLIRVNDSLVSASTAIDDSGRYAAVSYNAPGGWGMPYFNLVDINSCPNSEVDYNKIQDQTNFSGCKSKDLLAIVKQTLPTLQAIGAPQFNNDRTISFDVAYTGSDGKTKYARYSLTAFGQTKRIKQYLALGDSYISGEGAYSYREGTDTARNECHQSTLSYPYLLASHFESFASVACSGATMQHVIKNNDDRSDQLVGDIASDTEINFGLESHLPGAAPQQAFVIHDNPEAITISIGGNDIGFGEIMNKCLAPIKSKEQVVTAATCYDTYEDRAERVDKINGKFHDLRELYKTLKDDKGAGRRVYVIGYPQIAKVGGDCDLNVQMNATEIQFSHDLIAYLDSVIKQAADEAGVFYVDTQEALDGHKLCEASPGQAAVNGATISNNSYGSGYNFKASFHPNQQGHQMLASTIAAKTANLTAAMPAPAGDTSGPTLNPSMTLLQNVPKTGRTMRYVQIVTGLVSDVLDPRSYINFALDQSDTLLKAGGIYNLVLNSDPINLGNFTAGADGKLTVSAQLPQDVPPGFHTLHVYGTDALGNPIDIQQVVYIANSTNDIDGDGVPNETDSCPLATQSNVDIDQDGVDDACDPLIDNPPIIPLTEEAIIWWDKIYAPFSIKIGAGQ
jgi:lysophospholipase L1-like esterase